MICYKIVTAMIMIMTARSLMIEKAGYIPDVILLAVIFRK